MTFAELKKQILNLGFETTSTYSEEPTIMIDGINRAMREITNKFPLIGVYKIAQCPLTNLLGDEYTNMDMRHYDGNTPIVLAASGAKSFYFEYAGNVKLTVQDDNGTNEVNLTGGRAFQTYRAFANGDVTLTLQGDYSFDINNTAIYGEKYSSSADDIPDYRKHVRYDFKELTKQDGKVVFIDFLDKVQEGDGTESYLSLRDFHVEQRHVLVLDGRKQVEYNIFYKKDFTALTGSTQDTFEIELDKDREHLLPLLAAWYVWADDDQTKAAVWRNDYEDYAASLLRADKANTVQEAFSNGLGW